MKRMEPEHWEKQLTQLPLRQGGFSKELIQKVKERVELEQPQMRKNRWHRWSPALALTVVLAVGITQSDRLSAGWMKLSKLREPAALEAMDTQKEVPLKVSFFHEQTFINNYGKAFMIRYPNTSITVIDPGGMPAWSSQARPDLEEWIAKERPDVLTLSTDEYARLAKNGELYPLDAVIKQDGFDLQNMYAGVTDELRSQGGGKLYGLAPDYDQLAVYYNKELFDRYGVSYPRNGMSWEELLQLAGRFASSGKEKNKVYGLTASDYLSPYELVQLAGRANGLSIVNPEGSKVTVNTAEWKKLWSEALDAFRQGVVYQPQPWQGSKTTDEIYRMNPFLMGNAAITLQSYNFTRSLEEAQQQYKLPSFPWDIVTEPTGRGREKLSSSFSIGTVYAVNSSSENIRAAWELVKYINSEESARKMIKSSPGRFQSSRLPSLAPTGAVGTAAGKNLQAFYSLRPSGEPRTMPGVPLAFYQAFEELAAQQSQAVLEGKKTIDAALQELQAQGQQALTRTKNESLTKPAGSVQPGK